MKIYLTNFDYEERKAMKMSRGELSINVVPGTQLSGSLKRKQSE